MAFGLSKIIQNAVGAVFDALDDLPKTVTYHSTSVDESALQDGYDTESGVYTTPQTDYTIKQVVLARFTETEADKSVVIATDEKMIFPRQQMPATTSTEDTVTYFDADTGVTRTWEVVKRISEPSFSVQVLHVRTSGQ